MKFFKRETVTVEQITSALQNRWNVGFIGEEKPSKFLLKKVIDVPFILYSVREIPYKGKIIGWNIVEACTCFGEQYLLEHERKRFENVEAYNMDLKCPIHKK